MGYSGFDGGVAEPMAPLRCKAGKRMMLVVQRCFLPQASGVDRLVGYCHGAKNVFMKYSGLLHLELARDRKISSTCSEDRDRES